MNYASLTGPLLGLYLPLDNGTEEQQRRMMKTSSLARLWCSIYTEAEVDAAIERFGGMKLSKRPLDYDYDAVFRDSLSPEAEKIVQQIEGMTLCSAKDLQEGDVVDLESCQHLKDHPMAAVQFAEVVSVKAETPGCVAVGYEGVDEVGYPPETILRIRRRPEAS